MRLQRSALVHNSIDTRHYVQNYQTSTKSFKAYLSL